MFSDGSPHSPLMFVGEAPGEDEDRSGIPFVGKAGQKLTEIIELGLSKAIREIAGLPVERVPRSSVYIANVIKCRPPGNRDPQVHEVAACRDYLRAQIELVDPVVICALGKPAAQRLLGDHVERVGRIRGDRFTLPERPSIVVVPTYHPSYLLRQYTPENRKKVYDDICEVVRVLAEAGRIPWWT